MNKSSQWKRAFIGGLLSALAAGIPMSISYLFELQSTSFLLSTFLSSFALPGILLSLSFPNPSESQGITVPHILLSLPFWFPFGFGLTFFIKSDRKAIGWWLVLVIIPLIVITLLINSAAHAFR